MMSVLLVASVVSMVVKEPEYGAWDPVEVETSFQFPFETFQLIMKLFFYRYRAKLS